MIPFPPTSSAADFVWAGGIEDTFVPQALSHQRSLDEYELMGHYEHWREDLALIRASGMSAVRWGVPWYRVEPQPGQFDWSWTDEVIPYMVNDLKITPVIDLMHYGCPLWLKDEFASPDYPSAIAAYAAAFAARYHHLVTWYTPLNEPIVNALMCGRRGVWPPYLKGDKGYVRVMMALAVGICRTVEEIRRVQPEAMMVHVEASGLPRAADVTVAAIAEHDMYQNFLCYDLITGRVTPDHPLYPWLIRNGASAHDLADLTNTPLTLDVMGLNFYPQWSTQEVYLNRQGHIAYRAVEKAGEGFGEMIERYYDRYQVPVMITETSAVGSDEERANWLDGSLAAIKSLRAKGIPVIGYTWFPLFTMIDWRYRFGKAPLEEYYLELGLYRLNREDTPRWNASLLVERFQTYVQQAETSVGTLHGALPQTAPTATGRERLDLDGKWSFWVDPARTYAHDGLPTAQAISITVPAPWQSQSDELRTYADVAWYQRTFDLPGTWQEEGAVVLGFGAVDYRADVWLNGQKVGEHEGGYLPFEWEVQPYLHAGKNTITVRVTDLAEWFNEIPHGKQSWYGPLSGIWQSVWLERRAALYVEDLRVIATLESGDVRIEATLSAPTDAATPLRLMVLDSEGMTVARHTPTLQAGATEFSATLEVTSPQAWSPDTPYLYQVVIEMGDGADRVAKSFGFRTIEVRDGRFYLNGAPFYLRGALDQDYYPGTIATPPSIEFLEMQLRRAKELGLNCLRCHIKVPDPRYYEAADRLGMLIWTELPNWRLLTPTAQKLAKSTLEGIFKRDGHHPSIIIWTIVNENWGTNLHQDGEHRAWLTEMYHWLKALDPTRLVVDNSPCIGNFHVQSDIDDYHYYRAIPDQRESWDAFVEAMATRTAPTYSPYGDAVRSGQEPIVLSEFGNWGLPDVELLLEDGQEPWWFETGLEFNEAVYPHGVRERFQRWKLDKVFGSWRGFIEATQWQEFYSLKAEIESMRRTPEIAGYVITEFTDVHWEANGLLDLNRNPKVFHETFTAINGEVVVVPRWKRTAYWSGEAIEVEWTVSHGGSASLSDLVVRYGVGSGGAQDIAIPLLAAGETKPIATVPLVAPTTEHPVTLSLWCEIQESNGMVITRNELPLTVFPARRLPADSTPMLWSANVEMGARLQGIGYRVSPTPETAEVIVISHITAETLALANAGKTIIVTVQSADAFGEGNLGMRVLPRAHSVLQGDWVSSFAWLKREGVFAHLPGGPLLDYSFENVMPDFVLGGLGPWEYETTVHAGLFVGWIHKVSALLVEQVYGKGKLILTTLRMTPELIGEDVMATVLWDALVGLHGTPSLP